VGVEVTGTGNGAVTEAPGTAPTNPPRSPEEAQPLVAPVGPANNTALPPVDKPAAAPEQVNEVPTGAAGAQVQTGATASGKKKVPFDKKDESSSKHKKKKGLDKLNPF
jgi:outer membrane protein assembly factor BamD